MKNAQVNIVFVQPLKLYRKGVWQMQVRRGQIYLADLNPVAGSEHGGTVTVIVIQNDVGNKYAPTTIVAPITSQIARTQLPTRVNFSGMFQGPHISVLALLDQPRTLDKSRLRECIGAVTAEEMAQIDSAIAISFGLEHS